MTIEIHTYRTGTTNTNGSIAEALTITWSRYRRQEYGSPVPSWQDVTEPAVLVAGVAFPEGVVSGLGADHLVKIATYPHPAGHCGGRARGWWDANDLEHVALYRAAERCFAAAGMV